MTDYTPTTEEVRKCYMGYDAPSPAFDRWLNEERAKAYDEGASAVWGLPWDSGEDVTNPYRKADS